MTIHNTGYYYIRRSTVPLAKVCSSISENLRIVHADETDQLSVEVIPAPGGVEVDGTVVHPNPVIREIGQVLSETALALQPQIRGLETISRPNATDGVLTVPLKDSGYSSIRRYNLMDSHPLREETLYP